MKALHSTLAILILMLSLNMATFAQDETGEPKSTAEATAEVTVEPVPVVEPAPTETVVIIDSSIVNLIQSIVSILSVVGVSVWTVTRMGGTTKEAIKAGTTTGVRGVISDTGLSTTIEERLNAIPQQYRNFLMQFVNLASPITDTATITRDAAQWIKNVLDGNAETGAVPFTASSASENFLQAAVTRTPNKPDTDFTG